METTPFLDELAQSSLLAERVYTTVPRTSKAFISANCGIQPHLVEEIIEARPQRHPRPRPRRPPEGAVLQYEYKGLGYYEDTVF